MMMSLLALAVAIAPFVVVAALLAWANRRERRRHEIRARQIALTDTIHARFGAAAAPVLRRDHDVWHVWLGVPFECPDVTEALLATALDSFPPDDRDWRSVEIVLTRRPHAATRDRAEARGVEQEAA